MTPSHLSSASFANYPPKARAFADWFMPALRQFPINLCAAFLKQIEELDWKFPAEEQALRSQCKTLLALDPASWHILIGPFFSIDYLSSGLAPDWVVKPDKFMEQFTAALWRANLIDDYRRATEALFKDIHTTSPNVSTRLLIVLGKGAEAVPPERAFARLRPFGTYFPSFRFGDVWSDFNEYLALHETNESYKHWYIDGGPRFSLLHQSGNLNVLSYSELEPLRERVLRLMNEVVISGDGGPEKLRLRLRGASDQELGLKDLSNDVCIQRFAKDIFTDGSGCQIYSTSFVQWAAREVIRRARPTTMLLRYVPRARQQSMNIMLRGEERNPEFDPEGSLVDAEMGAYYAFLEAQAITDSGGLSVFVWHEQTSQAVLIWSGAPPGTVYERPATFAEIRNIFQ